MQCTRSGAQAVTLSQFYKALTSIWQPTAHQVKRGKPVTLGLAISGGVDSMALAYLCSELTRTSNSEIFKAVKLRCRAFVVDHQAREGSNEEAKKVAQSLRRMGIPTTILLLQWPKSDPQSLLRTNKFETSARRLRYRALGGACRYFRIDSLLVAHHQDDQAETVLLRILNQRTGVGLAGIKSSNAIPECEGMYGVHLSGGVDTAVTSSHLKRSLRLRDLHLNSKACDSIATGGVTVTRPLLEFTKSQLIETCKASGISWFEDSTNQNVRLTPRNAIRHLLASAKLPSALSKLSILQLANTWKVRYRERNQKATRCLQHLADKSLNLKTGSFVLLPQNSETWQDEPFKNLNRHSGLALAHQIAMLVTPQDSVDNDRLTMLRDILLSNANSDAKYTTIADITFGGISCQKAGPPSHPSWVFSRQPYKKHGSGLKEPTCTWHRACPSEPVTDVCSTTSEFWKWQLWDGRFWLRAKILKRNMLTARPLRPEDVPSLAAANPQSWPWFANVLKWTAPGHIKFTIPALVEDTDGPVLALPTLGFTSESAQNQVQWQVKYKHIGLKTFSAKPSMASISS